MPQTVVEKIAQKHMTDGPDRPVRAGDFVTLRPRHILTHDNTSAVISKFKGLEAATVHDPRQPVFALDHDIQNTEESNLKKYLGIEAFALQHGIDFYPAGTGIGHQIMVEHGYVVPGSLVVASDSHANMYGALGAIGTPVVRTDAAAIWATGEFWWQIPPTVKVELRGKLRAGVCGKDVIIALCGSYNKEEVLNCALEFVGEGVAGLSLDERLAIANMSTEWGALTAWFPADERTFSYLRRRRSHLDAAGQQRLHETHFSEWEREPVTADRAAMYKSVIQLDLSTVSPYVSGPDTVQVMHSAAALEKQKLAVQKAYLVGCANSRLEDIESAASVLKDSSIAPTVRMYIGAASAHEQAVAEAHSSWSTLIGAGAEPLPSACGPCIGLGKGLLEAGEVGISATNRNFKGRMGSRDAKCYLASPAVVAASAAAGYITAPAGCEDVPLETNIRVIPTVVSGGEAVQVIPGFPERVTGRLVLCPQDNINTDGIYGKDYTYRELPREEMARVVMQNYDPEFATRVVAGDVLVGGANFGSGSSREQAVTALQAKGLPLVIGASYSQTYLRNAFNNGFLCVECPELVSYLRSALAEDIANGARTVIPGDALTVKFSDCSIEFRNRVFHFAAMGRVPQKLVVSGGIEKLIAQQLKSSSAVVGA